MLLDFKKEDLSSIKEVNKSEFGFSSSDGEMFVIRNKEEDYVVGFANIHIDEDCANIKELEILYDCRGMQYGSTFINEFVQTYKINKLIGDSMYTSMDFWNGLGAKIKLPCDNCSKDSTCEFIQTYEMCNDYNGEFEIDTSGWH